MSFHSISELEQRCQQEKKALWQVILERDARYQNISTEASVAQMRRLWSAMKDSVESYQPDMCSHSGLVGGEGGLMAEYASHGGTLCGPFMAQVITRALMVACSNACMRRIVAAPTAGSCGVLPAVLYTCWKEGDASEDDILHALYVAAAFGEVIARRACISGAEGGCQAEIGSASGMAAAALTALRGGGPEQAANACAIAMKNLLGLVCDPVGGLVEIPCVKRNVVGAVNALAAADMALAGISSVIPVDQVIDAMGEIGRGMDTSLRETARGGLAATPRAHALSEQLIRTPQSPPAAK